MKSKTIIISSQNGGSGRGILTLYKENDLLKCKLRLYGVEKLNRFAKIGIYHNNEVFTANLLEKNGAYESSLVGNFDMDSDFFSAIIKTDNNNEVILSGGTYAGYYFNDSSVFEENPNQDLNNSSNEYHETNKPDLGDAYCDKCANCKYKEYFYNENKINLNCDSQDLGQQSTDICTIENNESDVDKGNKTIPTILEQIIPQFEYIFENFPLNEELTKKIENSKFVNMSDGDYSLGAMFDEGKIKYICYAVKSNYNAPAPEELGKHYQWLPLDNEDPLSDGYYIVFQDTSDLKIIEV